MLSQPSIYIKWITVILMLKKANVINYPLSLLMKRPEIIYQMPVNVEFELTGLGYWKDPGRIWHASSILRLPRSRCRIRSRAPGSCLWDSGPLSGSSLSLKWWALPRSLFISCCSGSICKVNQDYIADVPLISKQKAPVQVHIPIASLPSDLKRGVFIWTERVEISLNPASPARPPRPFPHARRRKKGRLRRNSSTRW